MHFVAKNCEIAILLTIFHALIRFILEFFDYICSKILALDDSTGKTIPN